jgi:hypothetical protein
MQDVNSLTCTELRINWRRRSDGIDYKVAKPSHIVVQTREA